jgi:AcrR family transcriptional regulator
VVPKSKVDPDGAQKLHPSARKLLDAALELLEFTPIELVHLADILERSGVSHGSLYHHFEDLSDLIEQAVVERYTQGLNDSMSAISALLNSTDAADFRRRTEAVILHLHDQNRRPFRLARLDTLGALAGRPRLAERIGRAQQIAIRRQADYYEEFQRRGWFRDDVDPLALSTFTTAAFLGRVVDDIAEEPVDPAEWSNVAMKAFAAILFPD